MRIELALMLLLLNSEDEAFDPLASTKIIRICGSLWFALDSAINELMILSWVSDLPTPVPPMITKCRLISSQVSPKA